VLDIETDSTIQLDEQFEKQQRTEFLGMLSQLLPQLGQMIMMMPAAAPFAGEVLKFAVAPFRVGRQLDGSIDDFVQTIQQQMSQAGQSGQPGASGLPGQAGQMKQEDPARIQLEREKLQMQQAENEKDRQLQLADIMGKQRSEQAKVQAEKDVAMLEYQGNEKERQAKIAQIQAQMMRDEQKHRADMQKQQADIILNTQKQQIVRDGMAEKNAMVRQGLAQRMQDNAANRMLKQQQMNRPQGMVPSRPRPPGGL